MLLFNLLKILAVLCNLFDYWTTVIGIKNYDLRELNPIARFMMKNKVLFFIAKVGLVSYAIITCSFMFFLVFFIVIFGGASINNLFQIKRKLRKISDERNKN